MKTFIKYVSLIFVILFSLNISCIYAEEIDDTDTKEETYKQEETVSTTPSEVEVSPKEETPKENTEKVEEKQAEKPLDTKPIVTPGYVKKPVVKPVEEEKIVSDITVDPEDIPDEKLNPDYIQSLLDRINDLEAGDDSVDRKELIMLNAELDAILMKLGSQ